MSRRTSSGSKAAPKGAAEAAHAERMFDALAMILAHALMAIEGNNSLRFVCLLRIKDAARAALSNDEVLP